LSLSTCERVRADEYVIFRFAEKGSEVLVFRTKELNQATEEILEDNGISPSRRGSEDMLKVWRQKGKQWDRQQCGVRPLPRR
jgi:hypothetical protein